MSQVKTLVDACLKELGLALKRFGTYQFDDKGPGEVMNMNILLTMFRAVDAKTAGEALIKLSQVKKYEGRGESLASALVGDMENWDELFEQPGIEELY